MKKFLVGATPVVAAGLTAAIVTGVLAFGLTPVGASNKQVTAVGSLTTYQLMHDLFPASLNDLLPGGSTIHQKIASTPTYCTGGVSYVSTPTGAPNGSTAGTSALQAEESKAANLRGCITLVRSPSPPQPTTLSTGSGSGTAAGTHFDYYAYALDGVAPMVGKNAGGTATAPATVTRAELKGIYRCKPGFINWSTLGGTTGAIVRFWPQSGSGTRAAYTNILGFTPEKVHSSTSATTCTTPAITHFTTVTVAGTKKQVVNEENESGLVYANKLTTTTPSNPTKSKHTIKDVIFVYSSGKFVSQWNNTSEYGTSKHNRISGTTIGNFTPTNVELAKMETTSTHGGQAFAVFTAATTTTPKRTGKRAHIDTTTVTEANEWYSHIPSTKASTASASAAAVPGVRYVFNICDTALPGYNTCKLMVGFDNQLVTAATTVTNGAGTKSRLCAGDDSSAIVAAGFVPLTNGTGPSATDNKVGAYCREYPGFHFPGQATGTTYRHWTYNTWVNPTETVGGGTHPTARYTEQPGYPMLNNTGTTLPVTTAAVGDVMLVMAHTAPSSGTSDVTSITDSNSRITWQAAKSAGFTNHPSGDAIEIWYGVVKSIGPTTIDVHWAGTTFDHFVWVAEWSSVLGADVSWSVASSGVKNAAVGSGTTCSYPTLTSGTSGGLYWGWAYGSAVGSPGTTPGFSYYVTTDPTHENVLISGPALAGSTAYTPTFTQAKATSWYDAAAVVVQATATAG